MLLYSFLFFFFFLCVCIFYVFIPSLFLLLFFFHLLISTIYLSLTLISTSFFFYFSLSTSLPSFSPVFFFLSPSQSYLNSSLSLFLHSLHFLIRPVLPRDRSVFARKKRAKTWRNFFEIRAWVIIIIPLKQVEVPTSISCKFEKHVLSDVVFGNKIREIYVKTCKLQNDQWFSPLISVATLPYFVLFLFFLRRAILSLTPSTDKAHFYSAWRKVKYFAVLVPSVEQGHSGEGVPWWQVTWLPTKRNENYRSKGDELIYCRSH